MLPRERSATALNLRQYAQINEPVYVGNVSARPDKVSQMILRMLVESPYSRGLRLPSELLWTMEIIEQAKRFQREHVGITHPFTYVTVRHGTVSTVTDDEWHVDGFSMRYNHLPEANYVFATGEHTTEFVRQAFEFPRDFDPRKHNVHRFFQKRVDDASVGRLAPGVLYLIDPYVVHRRPPHSKGTVRTFVRISFTPMEIMDLNNTRNPLIETRHYVIDGVREARDHLLDYDAC